MPRKPKLEKHTVLVTVDSVPVTVVLHPPTGTRTSWYAYWAGLMSSRSTGQQRLEDAVIAVENMVKNGGERATLQDTVLSDDEFEALQRAHFGRKTDPVEKARAEKTLKTCLEAIAAFRQITGRQPITRATADDCAAFQRTALTLPKNWRHQYPRSKKVVENLSANTILKWSRALQAAFERASTSAGRKCIRGVVDEKKLLAQNPWNQFTWIEGKKRPIRQFDGTELLSFLDYLTTQWPNVTVATLLAKLCLWSSSRRAESVGLQWSSLRIVGNEYHFEIVGKWGVEKWFRIPDRLYQELLQIKTNSPYVFAAYTEQLRRFYERSKRPTLAHLVGAEFSPECLGDWFHERIVGWSKALPKGRASMHVFRKTSLQYARTGLDVNRQVAKDARVSECVMMTNYVKETDEEMRQASNRTFHRILASLTPDVARCYGHVEVGPSSLEQQLQAAIVAKNWPLVAELSARLAQQPQPESV